MKLFRLRTLTVLGVAGLAGALLLHTSQNVQRAEDELAALKKSINEERAAIKALRAEWAYLNNPERLEKLAKEYLGLVPPSPDALVSDSSEIPSFSPSLFSLPSDGAAQNAVLAVPASSAQPSLPEQDFKSLLTQLNGGKP